MINIRSCSTFVLSITSLDRVLSLWLAQTTSLGAKVSMDWLLVPLLTTSREPVLPNGMHTYRHIKQFYSEISEHHKTGLRNFVKDYS